jgi:transposase
MKSMVLLCIFVLEMKETVTISKAEYQELISFKTEVEKFKTEVEWLNQQLDQLKRLVFGAKSERFIAPDPAQLSLFDLPAPVQDETKTEEITYTRVKPAKEDKKHPLRAELPAHLPRKVEVIEPENIPEGAEIIGYSITEILEYQPANMFVRQIQRPKYKVATTDEATTIITAQLPSLPIPKGNAGASVIAHILVSKFVDHLPYYRQSKIFKRQNLHIPDSTIGGWANTATRNWLLPLWETMKGTITQTDYLMGDETPIPVLSEDKPGATHRGYHWVYYDPVRKIVVFDYRETRGREGPKKFLEHFTGHLQTDGYIAYENLAPPGKITLLACMAHARRKFEKALENDPQRAGKVLTLIQELYKVERQAREAKLSFEQIRMLRQEESVKVLCKLENYLLEEHPAVLPQSSIGKAFNYTLNLWPRLKRYVNDGRFQIDNNLIENSIRPVALGRKNYLFAGSHDGARNAAVIYSLLATCKLNEIEPFEWLKNALETIPDYPQTQLNKLIPSQK